MYATKFLSFTDDRERIFGHTERARISCILVCYNIFGLYQMPDFVCLHLSSISREKITTAVFNELGNWLTFGCAKLGQLLMWEWKSESYILKQQGHYFDVNCLAYSPDSQLLATGADDNKVKVYEFLEWEAFYLEDLAM